MTELLTALSKALPKLEAAKKTSLNPHFKSKYADLGSVIEAVRPIAEEGIWWRQVAHEMEGGVCVETFYIGHGEEISAGKMFVPADKANAQGYGSAQTYARRYGLQLAFGLATEDDDGNAAAAAPPPRTNWGGRYPTKTKLREARVTHHAELERLGVEGTHDDLDNYLASPEYQDYVKLAGKHFPAWLEGERTEEMPEEYIQTFALEQKARDMIALRGNVPAGKE